MAELLIVKPKTLTTLDKKLLREAGIVVVEVANPDEVRFIRAQSELDGGDLALCAMKALRNHTSYQADSLFVKLIAEALEERKAKRGGNGA